MTQTSISLYESLTTDKYRAVDGQIKTFNFQEYVDKISVDYKIKRTRFFCDLNYFWYDGAAHFKPDWAVLPYPYDVVKKTWLFKGKLNQQFKDRIAALVKAGRKHLIQFLPCFATQGPDYKSTFFTKMGYPYINGSRKNHWQYYYRAESPENIASGAWGRLKKYYSDLSDLFAVTPVRFPYIEMYNEQEYGSWVDEYKGLGVKQRLQMNGEWVTPEEASNPDAQKFFKKMQNGIAGIKISKFAFHGVFTPADITELARVADLLGIPRANVYASTDGATPMRKADGSYRFSRGNSQGHYTMRIKFADPAFTQEFIDAACAIRDEAREKNIGIVDFQSPLKFQENLVFTSAVDEYYRAVMEV